MWVDSVLRDFGAEVRRRRLSLKLTQEGLSSSSGLHVTYLAEIEAGKRNPSLRSIKSIADGLSCSISDLFPRESQ